MKELETALAAEGNAATALLRVDGRFADGLALLKVTLCKAKSALEAWHPTVVQLSAGVASAQCKAGRARDALPDVAEALVAQREHNLQPVDLTGEGPPSDSRQLAAARRAATYANSVWCLAAKIVAGEAADRFGAGDFDGAAETLATLHAALARVLGVSHDVTVAACHCYRHAIAARMLPEGDSALQLTHGRSLRPEHPQYHLGAKVEIFVLMAQKKAAEAELLQRERAAALTGTLGSGHPHVFVLQEELAWSLTCQGRHAEATQLRQGAWEMRKAVATAEHVQSGSLAIAAIEAAQAHELAGAPGAAAKLLEEAHALLLGSGGANSNGAMLVAAKLADALVAAKRPVDAERVLRTLRDDQRREFGPSDERALFSGSKLAVLLYDQKRFSEAETIERDLLKHARDRLLPTDLRLLVMGTNLACTLSAEAKHAAAGTALGEVLNARNEAINAAIDRDGKQGTTDSCEQFTQEERSVEVEAAYALLAKAADSNNLGKPLNLERQPACAPDRSADQDAHLTAALMGVRNRLWSELIEALSALMSQHTESTQAARSAPATAALPDGQSKPAPRAAAAAETAAIAARAPGAATPATSYGTPGRGSTAATPTDPEWMQPLRGLPMAELRLYAATRAQKCIATAAGKIKSGEEAPGFLLHVFTYNENVKGADPGTFRVSAITTAVCVTVAEHDRFTEDYLRDAVDASFVTVVARPAFRATFDEFRRASTGSKDSPVAIGNWSTGWHGFWVAWLTTMLRSERWKGEMGPGAGWEVLGSPAVLDLGVLETTLIRNKNSREWEERMTLFAAIVQEPGKCKKECARERVCKEKAFSLLRTSGWPVICLLLDIGRYNNHGA